MAEMKLVRALRNGFYLGRRRTGEQFEVPVETLGTWFVEVGTPVPLTVPKNTLRLPKKGKAGDGSDLV